MAKNRDRKKNLERRSLKKAEQREQRLEAVRLEADPQYGILRALEEEQFPGFANISYKVNGKPSFYADGTKKIEDSVKAFADYNRSNGNTAPMAFSYNWHVVYIIPKRDSMGEYTEKRIYNGSNLIEITPHPSTPARIRGVSHVR